MGFLPISRKEMDELKWDTADFILVTGDAYVDHPSFGIAIISRVLEAEGYRVAILAQPSWDGEESFEELGRPRLGFLVTSGNIDSMVSNYTVAGKRRKRDVYSPGGAVGKRPDRAVIKYSKAIKKVYPDIPVIIGGLEASLRRFAHYDYWDNNVRPSILIDSGAELLVYGMGEHQILEIAKRLDNGEDISLMRDIRGTCCCIPTKEYIPMPATECPDFDTVCKSHREYAIACRKQQDEQDAVRGRTVIQKHGNIILLQNPPSSPLTQEELDRVYSLSYERDFHPSYKKLGGVPSIEEVKFSIVHNRGCFGSCNFCSISFHQGRAVTARSEDSVISEAKSFLKTKDFKGYISDVGGPTANFRHPSCKKQETAGLCKGKKCLAPLPCKKLEVSHKEYLNMLSKLRNIPGIKKVFIRSGIRFDYLNEDKDDEFFRQLVENHVSGQLKVAPEHCSDHVLSTMGKPRIEAYKKFREKFYNITRKAGKEQYLVPYLMSSHPGSTLKDAVELALFLKQEKIRPEQVQDFYPTPGTISTCMFFTGLDPYTMENVYVAKSGHEKALQRALLQYFKPENKKLVQEALIKCGRTDLIGNGKGFLVSGSSPGIKPLGSANEKHRGCRKDSMHETVRKKRARKKR